MKISSIREEEKKKCEKELFFVAVEMIVMREQFDAISKQHKQVNIKNNDLEEEKRNM